MRFFWAFVWYLCGCFGVQNTLGRTIFLHPNGRNVLTCGLKESNPCQTIQYAFYHRVESNDQIVLLPGVYEEVNKEDQPSTQRGIFLHSTTGSTPHILSDDFVDVFGNNPALIKWRHDIRNLTITSASGNPQDVIVDCHDGRVFWFESADDTDDDTPQIRLHGIRFIHIGSNGNTGLLPFLYSSYMNMTIQDCIFEGTIPSESKPRAAIWIQTGSSVFFHSCTFEISNSLQSASISFFLHASQALQVDFEASEFQLVDVCLYFESSLSVSFNKCTIHESQLTKKGCVFNSLFYMEAYNKEKQMTVQWKNCVFIDNMVQNGIYSAAGYINTRFENCLFRRNQGKMGVSAFVSSSFSHTLLYNVTFDQDTSLTSGIGLVQQDSLLEMIDCTIQNASVYGTVIELAGASSAQVLDTSLTNIESELIFSLNGKSQLKFFQVHMSMVKSTSAIIQVQESSNVFIQQSVFEKNTAWLPLINLIDDATGTIDNSIFESNQARHLSSVLGFDALFLNISSCLFQENKGVGQETSGVLYVRGSKKKEENVSGAQQVLITKSQFIKNSALEKGGAIQILKEANIFIDRCLFEENTVVAGGGGGGGGAIWVDSPQQIIIQDSEFVQNHAAFGGAICAVNITTTSSTMTTDSISTIGSIDIITDNTTISSATASLVQMKISSSVFQGNEALLNDHRIIDALEERNELSKGGNGGAIYLILRTENSDATPPSSHASSNESSKSCTFFENVTFEKNKAVLGGGAVYVEYPESSTVDTSRANCLNSIQTGSKNTQNQAQFGNDFATIPMRLFSYTAENTSVHLMENFSIRIGMKDFFGNIISGGHVPIDIRLGFSGGMEQTGTYRLISTSSQDLDGKIMLGKATFTSLAIEKVNKLEPHTKNATFYIEVTSSIAESLLVPIIISACSEQEGKLTQEGKCHGVDESMTIIVGSIVAAVLLLVVMVLVWWYYHHSDYVVQWIKEHLYSDFYSWMLLLLFQAADMGIHIAYAVCLGIDSSLLGIHVSERHTIKVATILLVTLSALPSVQILLLSIKHLKIYLKTRKESQIVPVKSNIQLTSSEKLATIEAELVGIEASQSLSKLTLLRMVLENMVLLTINLFVYVHSYSKKDFFVSKLRWTLQLAILCGLMELPYRLRVVGSWSYQEEKRQKKEAVRAKILLQQGGVNGPFAGPSRFGGRVINNNNATAIVPEPSPVLQDAGGGRLATRRVGLLRRVFLMGLCLFTISISTTSSISFASDTTRLSLYVSTTNGVDTEDCGVSIQAPPCKTLRYTILKSTSVLESGMAGMKNDLEILLEPGAYTIEEDEEPLKIGLLANFRLTTSELSAAVTITGLKLYMTSNPYDTGTNNTNTKTKITLEGIEFIGATLEFLDMNVQVSNCTMKDTSFWIIQRTFKGFLIQIEDCRFVDHFSIHLRGTSDDIARIERCWFQGYGGYTIGSDPTVILLFGFDQVTFDSCHFETSHDFSDGSIDIAMTGLQVADALITLGDISKKLNFFDCHIQINTIFASNFLATERRQNGSNTLTRDPAIDVYKSILFEKCHFVSHLIHKIPSLQEILIKSSVSDVFLFRQCHFQQEYLLDDNSSASGFYHTIYKGSGKSQANLDNCTLNIINQVLKEEEKASFDEPPSSNVLFVLSDTSQILFHTSRLVVKQQQSFKTNSSRRTTTTRRRRRSEIGLVIAIENAQVVFEHSLVQGFTKHIQILNQASVSCLKTNFENNWSNTNGGVFYLDATTSSYPSPNQFMGCEFRKNFALINGGVFQIGSFTQALIDGSVFEENQAISRGGALYLSPWSTVELSHESIFIKNQASYGGAIYTRGNVSIQSTRFELNNAISTTEEGEEGGLGGAIYSILIQEDLVLLTSKQEENCMIPQLELKNGTSFNKNQASIAGGGLFFASPRQVLACIQQGKEICSTCEYQDNMALYGPHMASSIHRLKFGPFEHLLALENPIELTIYAQDVWGNQVQGPHRPISSIIDVTMKKEEEESYQMSSMEFPYVTYLQNGTSSPIRIVFSKVNRSKPHLIDVPLNLTLVSTNLDLGMILEERLLLEKCMSEGGFLMQNGACFPLDESSLSQNFILGLFLVCTMVLMILVVLYFSYKQQKGSSTSARDTDSLLDCFVKIITKGTTNSGHGLVSKLFMLSLELVDFVSDLISLVLLFVHTNVFSLSLRQIWIMRLMSIWCFLLSIGPSLYLIQASIQQIYQQHIILVSVVEPTPVPVQVREPTKNSSKKILLQTMTTSPPTETLASTTKLHCRSKTSSSSSYAKALVLRLVLENVVQFLLNVSFYLTFQGFEFFLVSSLRLSLEISIVSSCFSMTLSLLKLSKL